MESTTIKKNNKFRNRKDHYSAISNSSSSLSSVSSQVSLKNKKAPRHNRGDNHSQEPKVHNESAPGCSSGIPLGPGRTPIVTMGSTVPPSLPSHGGNGNSPPVTRSKTTQGVDRHGIVPLVETLLNKPTNRV